MPHDYRWFFLLYLDRWSKTHWSPKRTGTRAHLPHHVVIQTGWVCAHHTGQRLVITGHLIDSWPLHARWSGFILIDIFVGFRYTTTFWATENSTNLSSKQLCTRGFDVFSWYKLSYGVEKLKNILAFCLLLPIYIFIRRDKASVN